MVFWYFFYFVIFAISLWLVYNTLGNDDRATAAKKFPIPDFDWKSHPEVANRLVKAISFKTVSYSADNICLSEIAKLSAWLEQEFPLLHGSHELVTVEKISEYSRLYKIRGSDPSLKGFLLNAHMDVVPTDNQKWSSDPFNSGVRDGFIFGRGAVDDKGSVMAIMESLSYLLREGFKPKRTIWVAICHDEEVSGNKGAKVITDLLESRNVQLEFVHDEGVMIFKNLIPGIKKEIALVGVSEKGYVDVEVSLNVGAAAGHSASAKPGVGVLGKLGAVAHAAEKNPMPLHLTAASIELARVLSFEMSFVGRLILRNFRFFWPLLRPLLSRHFIGNLFRTTSAVTLFKGGLKSNILASDGKLTINHRIHPEESVASVIARDKSLLNDKTMQITPVNAVEPHPTAPFDSKAIGFNAVKAAVEQSIGPEAVVVVPGLMVAASDSRHYLRLTPACYRFLPTRIKLSETNRYHGADEKISLQNYEETINFYANLIRNGNATSAREIYSS